MKTKLVLVCCGVLALGSGCATYDSGGTADDTVVVTGSGYGDYYHNEPYAYYHNGYDHAHYDLNPDRGPAVWKQPSPSGNDLGGTRPEFLWSR